MFKSFSVVLIVCMVLSTAVFATPPMPVGVWEFNDPGFLTKASIGQNLELVGTDSATAGITAGDGATAIGIGSHYKCYPGIPPNGAGLYYVNEYTILYDLSYPDESFGEWACILQTNTSNSNDGDYFKHPADESWGVGDLGYSDGNPPVGEFFSEANTWYRMVLSVKLGPEGSNFFSLYVNGEFRYPHLTGALAADGRFSIEDVVLFFADEDGEDAMLHVSNLAIWDQPLTAEDIALLGGPGDPLIPFVAYDPIPGDGQTVSEDWDLLSWQLPEPNDPGNTITCDVYFSEEYPEYGMYSGDPNFLSYATKIIDNQPINSLQLSSIPIDLLTYHSYYWRVDCYEEENFYKGFVWTFNTNNAAPEVDAGPDIRCWLTDGTVTVSIDGSVDDDGLPNPPGEYWVLWSVTDVNDLDYLTIHTTDAEDTDVTITEIGTYTLELEAGDGEITSSDTVTINVYSDACESAKADPDFELLFGDADEDCDVDIDDFVVFAGNWLACNRDDCL